MEGREKKKNKERRHMGYWIFLQPIEKELVIQRTRGLEALVESKP